MLDQVVSSQLPCIVMTAIGQTTQWTFHKVFELKNFVQRGDITQRPVSSLPSSTHSSLKEIFISSRLINFFRPDNQDRLDCIYLPLYILADKTNI